MKWDGLGEGEEVGGEESSHGQNYTPGEGVGEVALGYTRGGGGGGEG